MDRTRVMRRIALLGVGATAACGAKVTLDTSTTPTDAPTTLTSDAPAGAEAPSLDSLPETSWVADTSGETVADGPDSSLDGGRRMRCGDGDGGVCPPGSHCSDYPARCSSTPPSETASGVPCGDGWCWTSLGCVVSGDDALCRGLGGVGGPLAPPDLV